MMKRKIEVALLSLFVLSLCNPLSSDGRQVRVSKEVLNCSPYAIQIGTNENPSQWRYLGSLEVGKWQNHSTDPAHEIDEAWIPWAKNLDEVTKKAMWINQLRVEGGNPEDYPMGAPEWQSLYRVFQNTEEGNQIFRLKFGDPWANREQITQNSYDNVYLTIGADGVVYNTPSARTAGGGGWFCPNSPEFEVEVRGANSGYRGPLMVVSVDGTAAAGGGIPSGYQSPMTIEISPLSGVVSNVNGVPSFGVRDPGTPAIIKTNMDVRFDASQLQMSYPHTNPPTWENAFISPRGITVLKASDLSCLKFGSSNCVVQCKAEAHETGDSCGQVVRDGVYISNPCLKILECTTVKEGSD